MSQHITKFIKNDNVTLPKIVPLGSKGALLTYSTVNTTLSVGTNAQVLSANSATATGLEWVAPGANTALSNLASVAVNTTLVSDTDNTDDLGTTAINWKDLFIRGIKSAAAISLYATTDVIIKAIGGVAKAIAFEDGPGTKYVRLRAPNTALAADVTFILPSVDGTNGQYLQTNASGQLSFSTPPTGITTGKVLALMNFNSLL